MRTSSAVNKYKLKNMNNTYPMTINTYDMTHEQTQFELSSSCFRFVYNKNTSKSASPHGA